MSQLICDDCGYAVSGSRGYSTECSILRRKVDPETPCEVSTAGLQYEARLQESQRDELREIEAEINAVMSGEKEEGCDHSLWDLELEAEKLRGAFGVDYSKAIRYLWGRSNAPGHRCPGGGHTVMDSDLAYCSRHDSPLFIAD